MTELDVQIGMLPPMCVAVAQAVGPSPEEAAWGKVAAWAEVPGLFADPNAWAGNLWLYSNLRTREARA